MEFFNKKEDVIDLELTPFGEQLLADGDFLPKYYAFFDDDVLYDGKWAGIENEAQNKIKDRIKEVPRLKTQYTFANTEKLSWYVPHVIELNPGLDPGEAQKMILKEEHKQQLEFLKRYSLPLPLGNCNFEADKAPAWDIKLLYNDMDSEVSYFSSSMHPYLKIPQFDVSIKYKTEIKPLNDPPKTSADNVNGANILRLKEFDELHENPPVYEDGYYDFQEDFVVLEITEHNVPYLRENFDIEVFEITHDNPKYDLYYGSKHFVKPPSVVDDKGLLKSQEEVIKSNEKDLELRMLPLNSDYVEYFFNIYVDYEIDKDLICKLNPSAKQKGFFVSDPLDCFEDKEVNILSSDIYKEAVETTPECD